MEDSNDPVLPTGEDMDTIVEAVFASTFEEPVPVRRVDTPWRPEEPTVSCGIHILGTWNGSCTVETDEGTARRLAEAIFGGPVADAVVDDCVRELANVIGGNFKSLLGPRCVLSTPKVRRGGSAAVPGATEGLRRDYECLGGVLVVRIHHGDDADTSA